MSPSSFFSLFIQLQIHLLAIHPAVSLHTPQFTWTGPLSLHAQLDPATSDTIILQHANTVPGVVVTCLFQGIFQREINGSAVISGCRASPVVHVTIISRYLRGRTMFEIRDNLTHEVVSAYSGNQNLENEDEVSRFRRSLFPGDEMAQYDYLDYSDPMPTDLVLKMKFAYDESFKRHLGSDAAARKYIAEVVTHGKEYFKEESLGTNIFLDIQGPPQLLPSKELDISGPSFVQVQEVKAEEPIPLSVFCYTDDEDSLMGVSKRGKACDANLGISLTKWRCNVLKAAQTFAHESGHMDGFFHDAWEDAVNEANGITSNCEGTGLMSDDTAFEDRPNAWSICTSQRFAKWFRRFGKECIAEVIPCSEGSGSWRTPCKCGSGPAPSLCVAGHTCCQHQTATCLGEPSDIVKLYAIIQSMKLEMESLRRHIGGNDAGITTALAKATKLENCLTDVTSSDCPSSAYGKTAMSAGITANANGVKANADGVKANADGVRAIADGVKTNADGVKANAEGVKANADGVKTNVNEVKANTDKISSHNAALATKCDTSTCTNIETTATKIENCLTDVKSSDCPSSAYGKTAMSAAITANADGLKAIADGVKTNADGVKANAEGVKANADGVKTNANEVKANTDKISAHNAALATKCDTSICTNIETSATKIGCTNVINGRIVKVICEDGPYTVVIQRRGQFGNSENYFYKDFSDYENGFGSIDAELWLGLKNIAALTSVGEWELQVDLTDWDDAKYHALYTGFTLGPSPTYRLNFAQFQDAKSTLGDSLGYHKGHAFTTRDRDQDKISSNCAVSYKGAWWYNACQHSNLNGLNYAQQQDDWKGMKWYHGKTRGNGVKTWKASVIKIRRVDV